MENTTTMNEAVAGEIGRLVQRGVALQGSLRLSNRAFAARFKRWVGSEKTWLLLRENRWQGHNIGEKILTKLREFCQYLDGGGSYREDEFLVSLPQVRMWTAEFERLLGSGRDRRVMIVLAPEGVGKTWWARSMVEEDPERRIYVRMQHTWREKSLHIARGIGQRLGCGEAKNPTAAMEALTMKLRERGETILILDEGHYGGVALFRMMKDLIDETTVRIVYLAFPTEFDAVRNSSMGAVAEARQLLRRSLKPVCDDYRDGIGSTEVLAFLEKMIPQAQTQKGDRTLKMVAEQMAPVLAKNQNLSTLADAVEEATARCEDEGVVLTAEMVNEEVMALCSTAAQRRKEG